MNRRRQGYTLIECLVATTVSAILLATIAGTMLVLRQSERQLRGMWEKERSLTRLADQLRRDAHRAESAEIDDTGNRLSLNHRDGRSVAYRLSRYGVERERRQGVDPLQRELYRVVPEPSWRWQAGDGNRQLVSLVMPGPGEKLVRRITAATGILYVDEK